MEECWLCFCLVFLFLFGVFIFIFVFDFDFCFFKLVKKESVGALWSCYGFCVPVPIALALCSTAVLRPFCHSPTLQPYRQWAWQNLENLVQLKADIIPCFSSGAGQPLSTQGYKWTLFLKRKPHLPFFSICLVLSSCSRYARYLVDT